jgi:hypothetical protein
MSIVGVKIPHLSHDIVIGGFCVRDGGGGGGAR